MHLSREDRDDLAERIWQSVGKNEVTQAQLAEIRRRIEAVDRGEMATIDGDIVMREIFQIAVRAKAG
jgi:putative addiction module component (TIGR02574 family)